MASPMAETTHLYLLLDRLREAQAHQGAQLTEILRGQRELRGLLKVSTPKPDASNTTPLLKFGTYLKPIASSAGQWAGGILAMAYVAKGGDAGTALAMLLRLFG